jgi:hypothetical protein
MLNFCIYVKRCTSIESPGRVDAIPKTIYSRSVCFGGARAVQSQNVIFDCAFKYATEHFLNISVFESLKLFFILWATCTTYLRLSVKKTKCEEQMQRWQKNTTNKKDIKTIVLRTVCRTCRNY